MAQVCFELCNNQPGSFAPKLATQLAMQIHAGWHEQTGN
jgi:hypothetical protein